MENYKYYVVYQHFGATSLRSEVVQIDRRIETLDDIEALALRIHPKDPNAIVIVDWKPIS